MLPIVVAVVAVAILLLVLGANRPFLDRRLPTTQAPAGANVIPRYAQD